MKQPIPFVAKYNNLGEEFIVSAKVHMDETSPHMHIVFIPVIHKLDKESGKQINKIACSEFWKGKDSYKRLQDSFYKYVTKNGFDLERGNSIKTEHLSVEKFKQITEYNNIKYELNSKPLEKIETQNTALILEQNKQLFLYNNKLKNYLFKSLKAIEKVSELQEKNNNLQEENQDLKRKNQILTNYIEKTFEVIKHLFNFPIDRLKRIVESFIKFK